MAAGYSGWKSQKPNRSELLVDYKNVQEVIAFDEDGYMHRSTKYLEGNADLSMPEDLYRQVRDEMPAPPSDYDPIVRTEMTKNSITYYTKSGEIANRAGVNPEKLWVDPAILDSLRKTSQEETDAQSRVARNMARLKVQGLDFKKLGSRHVLMKIEAVPGLDEENTGEYQQIIDLGINRVIRSSIVNKDGNYRRIAFMNYKTVNGYPVMASSETLHFGMVNGKWGVKSRTVRNRRNIKVHF